MIPHEFLPMYLGANAVALGILALAFRRPRWVRGIWVAIFVSACVVNTRTAALTPLVYVDYAALTPSELYRTFIEGWFSSHIRPMVFTIAAGQAVIAGLLWRGGPFRRPGVAGASIFLLAIAPLGVGSGFPFSLVAIASLFVMERKLSATLDSIRVSPAAPFIPDPDIREVHHVVVRAPAGLVFHTAAYTDLQSLPLVRLLIRIRGTLMGDTPVPRKARGLVAETLSIGWGVLNYVHDRTLVIGAMAQPWARNVTFDPIPPEIFAAFAEGDAVKIVWTLEVEPLGAERTRFVTETRVVATSARARRLFRWYWFRAGAGIILIRWSLLRAVKAEAERAHREAVALRRAA